EVGVELRQLQGRTLRLVKGDRAEIDLPLTVARCTRVVGEKRRTGLREEAAHGRQHENERERDAADPRPPPSQHRASAVARVPSCCTPETRPKACGANTRTRRDCNAAPRAADLACRARR